MYLVVLTSTAILSSIWMMEYYFLLIQQINKAPRSVLTEHMI